MPSIVAVVAELDVDAIRQPGGPDPLRREVVLLLRDRDRRHAAAELAGGVEREAAPARPDLEDVHARAGGRRRSAMSRYLSRWASARVWSGGLEDRARVGHRLVEEQPVEVVAQVVVGGDVPAAAAAGCSAGPGGRRSAGAAAGSATSPGSARAPPGSARASSMSADQVRARTTGRPCTPRRRRSRRGAGCGRRAASSWTRISARRSDSASPNVLRGSRRAGRPSGGRPGSGDAAASRDPLGERRQAEAGWSGTGLGGLARTVIVATSGVGQRVGRLRPCRWKGIAAPPQAQGMPVDEARSSDGSRTGGGASIRSDHPVGQRAPAQDQARRQQRGVALPLVDRDPQARSASSSTWTV